MLRRRNVTQNKVCNFLLMILINYRNMIFRFTSSSITDSSTLLFDGTTFFTHVNPGFRDRSLFMEGGEGNFFFPKFLKLKAPLKRAEI
jgi:hypothetical protein